MTVATRFLACSTTALGALLAVGGCAAAEPGNRPPVLSIDGPATVRVTPGQPVELRGIAADPDGDPVTLRWDLGDGMTVEGDRARVGFPEPGLYRVVLTGRDARGAAGTPAETVVEVGGAAAPGGNFALRFGGTGRDDLDRVKIPVDDPAGQRTFGADVGATDTTIEFWMRARPGDNPAGAIECGAEDAWINGNVVLDRDRFGQGRKFGLSVADGVLVFGLTGDGDAVSLCGRTRVDDDRWHHVALTRTGADGTLRLFVDGQIDAEPAAGPVGDVSYPDGAVPEASCNGQPCTNSDPYLVIGAEKHDVGPEYPSFTGLVDELRLSTVVRYTGPFALPTGAFAVDGDTAALYHFDEGSGTVVRDAVTTAPSDGTLRPGPDGPAAAWVPSDAPTGR
ncbi:MAG: PKD domain-containing protein [Pseudonocardia sp.]